MVILPQPRRHCACHKQQLPKRHIFSQWHPFIVTLHCLIGEVQVQCHKIIIAIRSVVYGCPLNCLVSRKAFHFQLGTIQYCRPLISQISFSLFKSHGLLNQILYLERLKGLDHSELDVLLGRQVERSFPSVPDVSSSISTQLKMSLR